MAAQYEMTDEEYAESFYAESFIAEHGLKVDALNTSVHGGRAYYTITVSNKRGSVQFTEYSPGAGQDVHDELRALADIIVFVSSLIEDEDAEPLWAHQAEVLEAITQTDMETLDCIFCGI